MGTLPLRSAATLSRGEHACQWTRLPSRIAALALVTVAPATVSDAACDGARRTRTADLLGAIQALSQLSYSPAKRRL
jgi:hypothetical protein